MFFTIDMDHNHPIQHPQSKCRSAVDRTLARSSSSGSSKKTLSGSGEAAFRKPRHSPIPRWKVQNLQHTCELKNIEVFSCRPCIEPALSDLCSGAIPKDSSPSLRGDVPFANLQWQCSMTPITKTLQLRCIKNVVNVLKHICMHTQSNPRMQRSSHKL